MTIPASSIMGTNLRKFNHTYKEFNDIYHDLCRRLDLSDSAFDILYSLYEMGDGCLQRDICQTSCLPKQTVHSSIRKLEQQGYLTLTPGKGRSMQIFLTPAGHTLIEEKILPVVTMENQAFSCMTPEEIQTMLRLHERYCAALRQTFETYKS